MIGHLPTIHAAAQAELRRLVEAVMRGEMLRGVEVIRWKKDGAKSQLRLYAGQLYDAGRQVTGIMVMAGDTTEFRRL